MKPSENQFTDAASMLAAIQQRMELGCGNHGCRIAERSGWKTNGRCRCNPKAFAAELRDIAAMIERESDGQ